MLPKNDLFFVSLPDFNFYIGCSMHLGTKWDDHPSNLGTHQGAEQLLRMSTKQVLLVTKNQDLPRLSCEHFVVLGPR